VLKQNDLLARELRRRFREAGVRVVSLVSSPGSGKTALLGKMLTLLRPQTRVAARSWKTCPTTALKPRCGIS